MNPNSQVKTYETNIMKQKCIANFVFQQRKYVRISVPVLLTKIVWDDEGFRSCRANAYLSLTIISHTHPKLIYSKGSLPDDDQALLCLLRGKS